jgi:hypothetical protein
MRSPTPTLADRRRALRLLSLTPLMSAVALAACGGGGGDAGGPAPVPPPPVPPAPGVAGPAWFGFGRDAQHTANGAIATQALNRVVWSASVDLLPQLTNGDLFIHYGSPVITSNNTVILPVKTSATGDFRIEARSGTNGGLIWSAPIDYVLPPHNWVPSCNFALTSTNPNRLYAPGAGGKLLVRDNADSATGTIQTVVFYSVAAYNTAPATFNATIFINTPITVDADGNVFFGFVVTGANPAGLVSGIARVGPDGGGISMSAATAAGDSAIVKVATNCAPALSKDRSTVYVAVNTADMPGTIQTGYLLALDSSTLATKGKVALLDPLEGKLARVDDDGTASPTVGLDGDVFYGVLETNYGTHNARGWLLHFNAALTATLTPGGFGWDDTASIVPRAMVPSYTGPSTYLLGVKYNNYLSAGGDGLNRIAVIDPNASQIDPISGVVSIMKEVLTILGPTLDAGSGSATAVREWCINTMAVDVAGGSLLANSEDGVLYRWDLRTPTEFSQSVRLTAGLGEAYTPTAIGADGRVYAINDSTLFSVGA